MSAQGKKLRVLLADDHSAVLKCVSEIVGGSYDVIGAVSDGAQVLLAVEDLKPDLIVMDIGMPEMDGIQTAKQLQKSGCPAKIIFLTVSQHEDYIAAAFAVGARGYVLKARMHSDLLAAIKEVMAGRSFVWRRSAGAD